MNKFSNLLKIDTTHSERLLSGILRIKSILTSPNNYFDKTETVGGWARTLRSGENSKIMFVELNDGSCAKSLQIVVQNNIPNFEELLKANVATCLLLKGKLVKSPAKGQEIEMLLDNPDEHSIEVCGHNLDPKAYPLGGKKFHPVEHIRKFLHLRPKTKLIGSVARIRNSLSFATHQFFNSLGFLYVHTPIITTSDCEGAGEMFNVTTLVSKNKKVDEIPSDKNTKLVDYTKDFFSRAAFLTVSGQLDVEDYCCGLTNVYTFGPTFRAENSHTTRHLAEFWMIEPEIAFAGMKELQILTEDYLKFCVDYCLEHNMDDLVFFNELFKKKNKNQDLIDYLKTVSSSNFNKMTYTEAINILEEVHNSKKREFLVKPYWGLDLGAEHERYLCEEVVKGPLFLYDYPKEIKSFYMRNNDDGKTVGAMDLLLPQIGEVVGGSVREERYDILLEKVKEFNLNPEDYNEYLELRKYGTVKHAGFGLGFERLVMLVTGLDNIREAIPFPRWPGHCGFYKE